MFAKIVAVSLALLCASQAASAQKLKPAAKPHAIAAREAGGAGSRETLEASATRLALHSTLSAGTPSRGELLGVLVLMSLRDPRTGA